ncbi:beta-N-acetylhexosaminidase [Sphaerisporangium corydalis]|uniref:beta-N-acetylhexosaminidase n=1 Tax=Sphaerisporangium corydalis TaxID=1441875 RepID=A0ABV9EK31_9ACTN|nr:beta-N-acetylhexosaminidase [Sphaerisporangium corydalis]
MAVLVAVSCLAPVRAQADQRPAAPRLVPAPVSLEATGEAYALRPGTRIVVRSAAGAGAASYLANLLRRSTGYALPVVRSETEDGIVLDATGLTGLGEEGYRLDVGATGVLLAADTAQGLFRGVQTLRQLLPAKAESLKVRPGPWPITGVHVSDTPRFAYRGVMLDVARHFFTVDQVKHYIDLAAAYKINMFHLHLSDDQGWRIAIRSRPLLTRIGGRTSVGGGPGGHYTQADYSEIVRYARSRFITLIPEIDTPGHTNAALASYASLNCDGRRRAPYTGTEVGFSSLCTGKDVTYRFLDAVIGELARLTPGPYINIGGDEAKSTKRADYRRFVARVQKIVHAHGKSMMGWEEIADARPSADSVAEHWNPVTGTQEGTELARTAARRGVKIVMAPADHAYLDMKYTAATKLGQDWAALVEARRAYEWDPAKLITGVGEDDVLGVEAPIWTESLRTVDDLEYMAYPRLPGIAEIGWSPAKGRSWAEYRVRLAAQGPRWAARSVNFHRSPQVPWPS